MTVLLDPEHKMKLFRDGGPTNSMYILVAEDGTVLENRRYPDLEVLESRIRARLGLEPL